MARIRLRRNKHQGMTRRRITGKKPMSDEQKAALKKLREESRARTAADLAKRRAKKKE